MVGIHFDKGCRGVTIKASWLLRRNGDVMVDVTQGSRYSVTCFFRSLTDAEYFHDKLGSALQALRDESVTQPPATPPSSQLAPAAKAPF